jgi:hypothetical protein
MHIPARNRASAPGAPRKGGRSRPAGHGNQSPRPYPHVQEEVEEVEFTIKRKSVPTRRVSQSAKKPDKIDSEVWDEETISKKRDEPGSITHSENQERLEKVDKRKRAEEEARREESKENIFGAVGELPVRVAGKFLDTRSKDFLEIQKLLEEDESSHVEKAKNSASKEIKAPDGDQKGQSANNERRASTEFQRSIEEENLVGEVSNIMEVSTSQSQGVQTPPEKKGNQRPEDDTRKSSKSSKSSKSGKSDKSSKNGKIGKSRVGLVISNLGCLG